MNASRRASGPRREGWETVQAVAGRALAELRRAPRFVAEHGLEIATLLALAGGLALVLGEFLTLFEVQARGIVVSEQSGGDHHSYALALVGAAAIAAVLLARSAGAWPPAAAAAGLALVCVAITLFGDLPDANRSDLVAGGRLGAADPRAGLWVQLLGGLALLVGSGAVALRLRALALRSGRK